MILVGICTFIFGFLCIITTPLSIITNHIFYDVITRIWAWCILFIGRVKVYIEGLDKFDHKSNYVIIGNHLSLMDIPPIIVHFPGKLRWVFKKELAKVPIFGWVLSISNIEVDRENKEKSQKSFLKAKKKLKKGVSVIIFPEGTRSITGEVGPFKKGAFVFSLQTEVNLLPYAIYGTREILPSHSKQLKSGKVFISFREPISVKGYTYENRNELIEKSRNIIIEEYEKIREKHKDQVEKKENQPNSSPRIIEEIK
jgi:1-acyl-sn-glycerol-3-phosphate acyltransferase